MGDKDKRDDKGRFGAGNCANPKGRPKKGETMTDILRENIDPEQIALRLHALAMSGDFNAMKYIYDRIDGTPRQTVHQVLDVDLNKHEGFEIVDKDGNPVVEDDE